jgi:hypothetical protein
MKYCARTVLGIGVALFAGTVFVCVVSFIAQLLYGHTAASALHFEAFMFVWILAWSWIVVAAWALRRMVTRAREGGITLDYIAGLTQSERDEFWKKHPLRVPRQRPLGRDS